MNLQDEGDNETDRTISGLFAEPHAGQTSDELFVGRVMGRIARRRRMRTAMSAGMAAALCVATLFIPLPTVMAATDAVASLPLLVIQPLQFLLLSRTGLIASLPLGIVLLALSSLRLATSD